ncbi:MAG: HsdR family type I site-specific deoxyribonuclease, partial [Clostridia bacterium]|nr:HsdR family type I site-specific deoxyribonuclease [Clostridia bacterium]
MFRGKEYNFSAESVTRAIRDLDASLLQGLLMASKDVYNHLTSGISVEEKLFVEGDNLGTHSFDLHYIDFKNPSKNKWQVTEEFSVERPNGSFARPDIVLLCNGIPLVVIENKKSSIDVKEGVLQNVRNMMPDYIPQLFKYAQLVLAVNPNKVVYGTSGTTADYFVEWREQDIEWQENICKKCFPQEKIIEQDRVTASLLDHKRLLEIIESFILYDNNIKKVARHQQYFAVKHAMARIKGQDGANTKSGVIWHTQGSGKSITMILLVKKIISDKSIENPRFLIVTDRVNLDKQIRDNFANAAMQPSRAKTGVGLKALIEDEGKIVVTTLINKFETVVKLGAKAKNSQNIFVFIDEAHRSNYSAMYNYMRDVLEESTFIAFTGTPLLGDKSKNPKEKAMKKKDTYDKFGPSIDTYTMKKAIEDGITVPLVYEGRKVVQPDPSKKIDDYFQSLTKDLPQNLQDDLKQKWSRFKPIAETDGRLKLIAFDLADHFVNYCLPKKLKAMLVCSSRASAVDMFNILKHIDGVKPAVVITFGDKAEGENLTTEGKKKIQAYYNEQVKPYFGDNVDLYDDTMTARFKSEEGDVNLLIVKDKLLTGFDAPIAGVLYVDKPIQQHSLLQAVARVNRVYKGKDFGLIVDYFGIFIKLNEAIDMYNDAEAGFNNFDQTDIEDAIFGPVDEKNKLHKAWAEVWEMFPEKDALTTSNEWQLQLEKDVRRHEFYDKLATFAKRLDLALTNRAIYKEVGFEQLENYRKDYLFFKKLKDAVSIRYNDSIDFSRYEDGIRNLLNTFVMAIDVQTIVKPVSIHDVQGMKEVLDKMETSDAKADAIKTKVVSELKQKR